MFVLLALGLLASPAPAPVDCTHGVLLWAGAASRCITPGEANGYLAAAGQSQRINVAGDGRAVVVKFLPLW